MSRFAIFGAQDPNAILPRLDPVRRERRIDPHAPVVHATLEGRPVVLARMDPLTRRPGDPSDLTVPLTMSRYQHALDIEHGYRPETWEPTPLVGFGAAATSVTRDVINCAPFKLKAPRALTPYEWTVAEEAVHNGMLTARPELIAGAGRPMAAALTHAIAAQAVAPAWKQTWLGPAPAVNRFYFGCIGSWFANLDPISQGRALASIVNTGLMASASPPWGSCPAAQQDINWRPETQSEYSPQKGDTTRPGQSPDACWKTRMLTGYFPTTGAELVNIMRTLGGGTLSPELQRMVELGGSVFANRSFLVGISLREQVDFAKMPESLNTMADMMRLLDAMVADIVLIWAPYQGASLHSMLVTGQIDPAALQALVTGLAPAGVEQILQGLPGILTQILPGLTQGTQGFGLNADDILSASTSYLATPRSAPGEPLQTGLAITDAPGGTLPKDSPEGIDPVDPAGISGPGGVYLALGMLALGAGLYIYGRKTQ